MKLHEIADEEPLLLVMIRKLLDKKQKVAWYIRKGDRFVPVWVHDWHEMMKTYGDGPQPVWTIRGYQGYNVQYKHIRKDQVDKWTLIPGKTKNSWRLKLADLMVKEGLGSDLANYMDFAESTFKGAVRRRYDQLARELFKRGFSFQHVPESSRAGRFIKADGDQQVKVAIVGPKKTPRRALKNTVMISITTVESGRASGKHQPYEIEDLTDPGVDLDYILSGEDF